MEGKNNGVKITFIETQFVTSDAASFKSLVQRLTGKPAAAAAAASPLHRPRPSRPGGEGAGDVAAGRRAADEAMRGGAAVAVEAGSAAWCDVAAASSSTTATAWLEELHEICDLSELLLVGGSDRRRRHGGGGSYDGFPLY